MNRRFALAFLGVMCASAGWGADGSPGSRPRAARYDPAAEVVVKGTVEEVRTVVGGRRPMGAYLQVRTALGKVDIHLGLPFLLGRERVNFTRGELVEVVGAVVLFGGSEVLLARQIRRGEAVLTYRSERGLPAFRGGSRR